MQAQALVRVSSRSQDHATQRDAIERAAAARGDTITCWRVETRSGKTMARPELDRLREDLRTGRVPRGTPIYAFKLDRLTRSGVADTYQLVAEIRKAQCPLVAVADNLLIKPDSDDLTSEVLLFALALCARIERTSINDRISAARDRVEAAGGSWGRPPRLTAQERERVLAMRREGRSLREIAVAAKVPLATVARACRKAGLGGQPASARSLDQQQGACK